MNPYSSSKGDEASRPSHHHGRGAGRTATQGTSAPPPCCATRRPRVRMSLRLLLVVKELLGPEPMATTEIDTLWVGCASSWAC